MYIPQQALGFLELFCKTNKNTNIINNVLTQSFDNFPRNIESNVLIGLQNMEAQKP